MSHSSSSSCCCTTTTTTATATSDDDDDDEEEEEPVEDKVVELQVEGDEDECFYESLDRILSSSDSSTSVSSSDDAAASVLNPAASASLNHLRQRRSRNPTDSSFPVAPQIYGTWITESFSCSVEQRRDRLLQALGLAGDPSLSRRRRKRSVGRGRRSGFGRSSVPDEFNGTSSGGLARVPSKSGGSISPCESGIDHQSNGDVDHFACNGLLSGLDNPMIKRMSEIGSDSADLTTLDSPSGAVGDGSGGRADSVEHDCHGDDAGDHMCTIKNLDNGKEFVVNEVREDGMWKKLREVGTGRQLTMEEFEMCVGHSPIVHELMRRQNFEQSSEDNPDLGSNMNGDKGSNLKNKVSWLKSIRSVATSVKGHKERRSSDEKDTSSEKGGRRSSSATDDSQDVLFHGPEKVRVRQYGKTVKEMSALYKCQEIQAHTGSIWTIKFSLDGRFLASAGEDRVIHVWQVVESERKGELLMDRPDEGSLHMLFVTNGSPELCSLSPNLDCPMERRRRGRTPISRKPLCVDHIVVPDIIFALSEKPICSFQGHLDDVLDLSWSKSQLLLSSSMDKTVRLWDLSSMTCLKVFAHGDYVTCIQFNPVNDRYFISGSLDAKVRIWSIPDRQVVDWNDLHEMVTAACYTPDGQGALVGSYKGNCRLYNTSENKLQQKRQINLQNKKKKPHLKKITGFQFAPGSSTEVLVTSADSRIRVIDGVDLVHKFKGFQNSNSQISAAVSANGKYVVCASEDSRVYVWKHEGDSRPGRSKGVTVTRSYEHFHCQDVYVAIPWPGIGDSFGLQDACFREHDGALHHHDEVLSASRLSTPSQEFNDTDGSPSVSGCNNSRFRGTISGAANGRLFDRMTATWPEEKLLLATKNHSPCASLDLSNGLIQNRSAWGMVMVTAGLKGEITTFQNFGLPVRI